MLQPFFFQRPPELSKSFNYSFQVLGYSKVNDLTLVDWSFGHKTEFIRGQTIYRRNKIIISGTGSIFTEPITAYQHEPISSAWDDPRRGNDGDIITQTEFQMLRKKEYYRTLSHKE